MFKRENNVGIYLTVAFHLLLLIIFLSTRISLLIKEESSFILDFTKEELIEELARLEEKRDEIGRELDQLLADGEPIRNIAKDLSSQKGEELKDDRYKDPSKIYDEARELQERLEASRREAEAALDLEEQRPKEEQREIKEESYRGPTVLSYLLEGRKAIRLPIPVYKCVGGGEVAVSIVVNRRGVVTDLSIIEERSAKDRCIRDYALLAAKGSRFTTSDNSPERQVGEIVYRFIAQ